jgi:succinate dehydrogenase/fumarate reductase flavoprotein subunit
VEGLRTIDCDVLVIGGGLAGSTAALAAALEGAEVVVADKGYISRAGCSPLSGGVMTGPIPSDDLSVWAHEFVQNGGYMNNQLWLDRFLSDQVERLRELQAMGDFFVRNDDGSLRRIRSRGMTNVRCVQFNPRNLMSELRRRMEAAGARILDRYLISELITSDDGAVAGAVAFQARTGEVVLIRSGATVVASGPLNLKGRNICDTSGADGHALAYRAGAELIDMEFLFGGTFSLMLKKYKFPAYNVALGHGARLINAKGERFMQRYDPNRLERAELPQVIAAFLNEVLSGRGPCYIDLRYADENLVKDLRAVRGDYWADQLVTGHIKDYRTRPVLIEPQWTVWSHRCGIRIDLDGRTNIAGLYAAGSVVKNEAMGTHASAGSPTAFCCVSGTISGKDAARHANDVGHRADLMEKALPIASHLRAMLGRSGAWTPKAAFTAVRRLLGTPLDCMLLSSERIATLRSGLADIRARLPALAAEDPHELVKAEEVRNFVDILDLCMAAADQRKESRESFFRRDYPETDNENWFCWHVVRRDHAGTPTFHRDPIPIERYRRRPERLAPRHESPLALNLSEALHGPGTH